MTTPKTPLATQIAEIMGDIQEDYADTILTETDPQVVELMIRLANTLVQFADQRPPEVLARDVATTYLWMILLGREHHARGFDSPVPKKAQATDVDQLLASIREGEGGR